MRAYEERHLDLYSFVESANWIWRSFGIVAVVPKGSNGKYTLSKILVAYNILIVLLIMSSHIGQSYNIRRERM